MIRGALIALALALTASPTWGESPRVREVDGVYQDRKAQWENRRLPSGLAGGASAEGVITQRTSGVARTAMHIRNVDFRIAGEIGFEVRDLIVTLEPLTPGAPVNLDKVENYVIRLHRGEVLVRARSLSALFNRYILDYKNRSLNNVAVSTADGRLSVKAGLRLNQLYSVELPSTLEGNVQLTPENTLSFDIDGISVSSIPVADVLKAVGISLPSLVRLERKGASLSRFGLTLDHRTVFPPPYFRGNVASASLSRAGLHLTFMDAPNAAMPPLATSQAAGVPDSFIRIESGDPKLFGLIVLNARVLILPAGPGPLLFDLYDYRRRLSRGQGHIGEDGSIVLRVPD
jgi:hypothetical protein